MNVFDIFETCRSTLFYSQLVWVPHFNDYCGDIIITIIIIALLCLVYVVYIFRCVSEFVEVTLSLST